jgi:hypothetical protein
VLSPFNTKNLNIHNSRAGMTQEVCFSKLVDPMCIANSARLPHKNILKGFLTVISF